MGDPRVETKPLSWDVLTRVDMIGEPVFNSNSRHWMLLLDIASDRTWIELINHAGGHEKWIEHDAQKYPLYATRVMKLADFEIETSANIDRRLIRVLKKEE